MKVSKFVFIEAMISNHEYYDFIAFQPCESKREEFVETLYKRYCQQFESTKVLHTAFINEFYDTINIEVQSTMSKEQRSQIEEVFYEIVCKNIDEGNAAYEPTSEQLESFFEKFMKNFDNTKDVIDQVYNFFNTSSMAKI